MSRQTPKMMEYLQFIGGVQRAHGTCHQGRRGEDEGELTNEESAAFRSVAARANIQLVVREACRGMSKPSEEELRRNKRLTRYFKGARQSLREAVRIFFTSTVIGPYARRRAGRPAGGC